MKEVLQYLLFPREEGNNPPYFRGISPSESWARDADLLRFHSLHEFDHRAITKFQLGRKLPNGEALLPESS